VNPRQSTTATFAAVYAALAAGHEVGDFWLQRDTDARSKGAPGAEGRKACAVHVATYTATQGATLALVQAATGTRASARRTVLGLAFSAATHYAADRRTPLKKLADLMQPWFGKADFYTLGAPREGHDDNPAIATGAFHLDQSWHAATSVFAAALIIAGGAR
jgi:hypothetical protein